MVKQELPLRIGIYDGQLTLFVDTPQKGHYADCKSYVHLLNLVLDEVSKGNHQYELTIDNGVTMLDTYQVEVLKRIVDLANGYESKPRG